MKFFIIFPLAFATIWAKDLHSRSIEAPVIKNEGRIVNGKNARPGQFNYQVGLNFKKAEGLNWCSGSFIGATWILTAAQCIEGASLATVYMGGTVRTFAEKYYTVLRNDMITYPGWNHNIHINDIGLMRIKNTSESGTLGIIKLPKDNKRKYLGAKVFMSGWGQSSDTLRGLSNDLQYAELKVSRAEECHDNFGIKFYYERDICVETTDLVSPCPHDNGGPLVLAEENIQIGVFSYGSPVGCEKGYPTVFARVSSYLSWIETETGIK